MPPTPVSYTPPAWAAGVPLRPTVRLHLSHTPTPVHPWAVPGLPDGLELSVKRDDLTGFQLSGNKVRKLEFEIAQALSDGSDSVITLGGIQSNHARATAVAARYCGLDAHLILRVPTGSEGSDPGLGGNLLVSRAAGAHIHLVSRDEYVEHGQVALARELAARLRSAGLRPRVIPVGGSSPLGVWGYLAAVEELAGDLERLGITDVVVAAGSGGTLAGLAIGLRLWQDGRNGGGRSGADADADASASADGSERIRVHAYAVCDSPSYFHEHVDEMLQALGVGEGSALDLSSRRLCSIADAKGAGYAIPRDEELRTLAAVARATGVLLDPVYTGKALHGWLADVRADPDTWRGRKVLFIHTGGQLGAYAAEGGILRALEDEGGGRVRPLFGGQSAGGAAPPTGGEEGVRA